MTADNAAPVGPSPEEESAYIAEQSFAEVPPGERPVASRDSGGENDTPLPPMEDLVKRIPAPARELMEELFRARFVTVKRVPKSALRE